MVISDTLAEAIFQILVKLPYETVVGVVGQMREEFAQSKHAQAGALPFSDATRHQPTPQYTDTISGAE